jgi:MoaA/NifB/PqqE/SkfB family radical SAM enzyme
MTRREWVPVLDDLRALGTLFVTLTGGDPLAHPEFLAIARDVRERRFALVVLTSGLLVDGRRAREIARLSPLWVELSLHGASAASHDAATRVDGSFAAVGRAVARLRDAGTRVRLKTPVTRLNFAEVEAIAALAASWQATIQMDPVITHRDDGDTTPLGYRVRREDLPVLVDRLAAIGQLPPLLSRSREGPICGLGRSTVAIDPEGNVFPCLQWRGSSLGSARQRRLASLWRDSPAREVAAATAVAANRCLSATEEAIATFRFCPALALEATQDATGFSATHRDLAQAVHGFRQRAADS